MDQSTCSVPDCQKPAKNSGMCWGHYEFKRAASAPVCSEDGCGRPGRKRGWCGTHYSRWLRNGSVSDSDQSWIIKDYERCLTCDERVPARSESRRYCSRSCAVMFSRPTRQATAECAICGKAIDLAVRGLAGRRKYRNAATCATCRAPHLQRHVPALVERDGLDCGICGDGIDLTLTYPHPLSKSVDHVLPRSRGGADRMTNYQLSHLRCNVIKNNREGFTLRA